MEIIAVYSDSKFIEDLQENLNNIIPIESYSENIFSEKKKAIMIKSSWGSRQSPFVLIKDDGKAIKAFYSEDNSCTLENILSYVGSII